MLFQWIAALFFIGHLYAAGASEVCGKHTVLNRINGEPFETLKIRIQHPLVKENIFHLKSRKDLEENFQWAEEPDHFIPEQLYTVAYKFSITKDCEFVVSKTSYANGLQRANYDPNHVILAGSDQAITAGALYLLKDKEGHHKIKVANQSSRFCPSMESLKYAKTILEGHGWPSKSLELIDLTPSVCK